MMRKLLNKIKQLPHSVKLASAALLLMAAIPVAVGAYGPVRPTFDYNKYDASDPTCRAASNDHGRCGSMNGPVFNSFINVPGYGDERNFVTISPATAGDNNPVDNTYTDELNAEPGQEYWVRIYVHNNANSQTNDEDLNHDGFPDGVARNTRVSFSYVDGLANAHDLKAVVSADNATPAKVWDEGVLRNNGQQFRPQFVPGSAMLVNGKHTPSNPLALSDAIATSEGVKIGYDQMDGKLPGCFDFQDRVYVKVRVKAPKILVRKFAFLNGKPLSSNQTVEPGATVNYRTYYYNVGNDVANDITLKDTLPANTTFVAGSLKWFDRSHNGAVQSSSSENVFFNQGGLNVGNYNPLTDSQIARVLDADVDPTKDPYDGYLSYDVKVPNDKNICQVTNVVSARMPGGNTSTSQIVVYIDRNGSAPGNGCGEEKCKVRGFEHLPANSPLCKETPQELPNTGPGDVAGLFGAVTVAGAMFHRFVLSRKSR